MYGRLGPGIFDDDVAVDVQRAFEEYISQGESVEDAIQSILQNPPWNMDDEEDAAVMFLALAELELRYGALDAKVRDRALTAIDSGILMWRWKRVASTQRAERLEVLRRLKQRLISSQGEKEQ